MQRTNHQNLTIPAALAAGLLAAIAAPAQAVNVPDGGAVPPGRVSVVHFRVLEGCEGQATESLELRIPEGVTQVIPEAVPGWTVATETVDRDGVPEVSMVRWTGGPLPDGQMLEFGLRAAFPDEPGAVVQIPAVQGCSTTTLEWSGVDEETPAPVVRIAERLGAQDLIALGDAVAELRLTVDEMGLRLGDVDAPNLRSRVSELESSLQDMASTLDDLDGRLDAIEEGTSN
jgi:periplasmic copper chaperone A